MYTILLVPDVGLELSSSSRGVRLEKMVGPMQVCSHNLLHQALSVHVFKLVVNRTEQFWITLLMFQSTGVCLQPRKAPLALRGKAMALALAIAECLLML